MLVQSDYNCIGIVAQHCDNSKLCIAENEALLYDLAQLYCDFWNDVLDIWEEINTYREELAACEANPDCITPPIEPDNYDLKVNLIFGSEYLNCAGKTRSHLGVKNILVYYSYARYVILNGFNDTPSGLVRKTNDFSIQVALKELEDFANKYRNMGLLNFGNTNKFLCAHKANFENFDSDKNCGGCGCGSDSCGGTKAKGYGFKSRNISKNIDNDLRKDKKWPRR